MKTDIDDDMEMEKDKEKGEKKDGGEKKKNAINEDLPPYFPAVQVSNICNN